MADVFISYKREDRAVAEALDARLQAAGFTCWWDTSLVAGEYFNEAIQRELAAARCVVVLWTKASHQSQWVQAEAIDGFNRNILVAARLDDVTLQYPYGIVQTADLKGWKGAGEHRGVADVIAGVAGKVGRKARQPAPEAPRPPPPPAPLPRATPRAHPGPIGTREPRQGPIALYVERLRQRWRLILALSACLMIAVYGAEWVFNPRAFSRAEPAATEAPSEAPSVTPASVGAGTPSSPQTSAQNAGEGARVPESVFRDCADVCPEMVAIPAGSFTMGSSASEKGRYPNEGPQHTVTVPAFAAGKYEVTFDEWDACVADGDCGGYRPEDEGFGRGKRPIIHVSWEDAQGYVTWLTAKTGKAYRLLTEAEWEYAARAGTTTAYWWGDAFDSGRANLNGSKTVAVGSYPANAFGLFDTAGNVYEWVQDCYAGNYAGAPTDGSALETNVCSSRGLRGGSWDVNPRDLRSAIRGRGNPTFRYYDIGFRVARTVFTP